MNTEQLAELASRELIGAQRAVEELILGGPDQEQYLELDARLRALLRLGQLLMGWNISE